MLSRRFLLLSFAFLAPSSQGEFCVSARKTLSDAELIVRAVGDENIYPNCCRVNRGSVTEVEAYLKVDPIDQAFKKYPPFYETHLEVSACGEIQGHFGMHVTAEERPCWVRGEKMSSISDLELSERALALVSKQLGQSSTSAAIKNFLFKQPDCCSVKRNVVDEQGNEYAAQVVIRIPQFEGQPVSGSSSERISVAFNPCADWAHTSIPDKWQSSKTPWAD